MKGTLKFRHQRSVNHRLECFDSWVLLRMLASTDLANIVSQEASERASLPEISAHVIALHDQSHALAVHDNNSVHERTFVLVALLKWHVRSRRDASGIPQLFWR